jgi:hypothetical protein
MTRLVIELVIKSNKISEKSCLSPTKDRSKFIIKRGLGQLIQGGHLKIDTGIKTHVMSQAKVLIWIYTLLRYKNLKLLSRIVIC